VAVVNYQFYHHARRELLCSEEKWRTVAEEIRAQRMPSRGDLLERAVAMDFENYLPEDILVKVDRASMLNSLEVRAPLLDHRIIEFAFGRVPPQLKATVGSRKVLLKALAKRVLPSEFDRNRKQGFSVPLNSWLRSGPWLAFFKEVLLGPESAMFCHSIINRLFSDQERGRANGERLFGLVMFELWRRQYGILL
jgi:asparagine synthase (glutamine-hydrolysing)